MARQIKEEIESRIPPENTASFRLLLVSLLSAGIGISVGIVAFILYNLIGLFTNLALYQRFSFSLSPRFNTLGPLVITIPGIGDIAIATWARYWPPFLPAATSPRASRWSRKHPISQERRQRGVLPCMRFSGWQRLSDRR